MAPSPEERFMWSNKPHQQAKQLVAAIFVQPRQRSIDGQIVGIHIAILLLRPDRPLAPFLEKWIGVVIRGIVVAEIIIPITIFNTVRRVHLSEDGNLIAGLVKNVSEERNVGRQRKIEMLVGERSRRTRIHARESCRTRRSTESVGAEGILESHAFAADAVVIGRLQNRIAGD